MMIHLTTVKDSVMTTVPITEEQYRKLKAVERPAAKLGEEWHHHAHVFDGCNDFIYVDGTPIVSIRK